MQCNQANPLHPINHTVTQLGLFSGKIVATVVSLKIELEEKNQVSVPR